MAITVNLIETPIGVEVDAGTSAVGVTASTVTSVVRSLTAGITGATAVANIVAISQANYDALAAKDSSTIYVIV
jgi:hypothetical protein